MNNHAPSHDVPSTCPECGGTMELEMITHEERNKFGMFAIVENVPAWVCRQCGAIYLDAATDKVLDNLIDNTAPVKKVETPVFDFAKAKS